MFWAKIKFNLLLSFELLIVLLVLDDALEFGTILFFIDDLLLAYLVHAGVFSRLRHYLGQFFAIGRLDFVD